MLSATAPEPSAEIAAAASAAAQVLRKHWPRTPRVGVILGTGLGSLADHMQVEATVDYDQIPGFPRSTALGHRGRWVCGELSGQPILAMQGRFHLYEGYSARQATLPVRVMQMLGVQWMLVSNASGGLNPQYASGDVMVIDDHINLMWRNPLIGDNDDQLGPRFPDMSSPYCPQLAEQAMTTARGLGVPCHRGVYAAMAGPSYETRAEYRMLRRFGADVVGMSTVPEVLVAVHCGLPVLGLSAVTNLCRPDTLDTTDGHAVEAAAETAEPKMRQIVTAMLADLPAA